MANPVSSVSGALQSAHIAQHDQVRDANPNQAPKQQAIPQDTVSIKSGAAASQAQAASKSAQGSSESESGEAK